MSTVAHPRMTPEELLKLPDGERYELVDGELVECGMSGKSVWLATWLSAQLVGFAIPRRLGYVLTEASIQCFADPGKVRRPDVAFFANGRMGDAEYEAGHIRIAPDLAVEVVSPNDLAYEVALKSEEYLAAGVRLVWIIHPETQTVDVLRADGSALHLRGSQQLSGEDVLPGFEYPLPELFCDLSDFRHR